MWPRLRSFATTPPRLGRRAWWGALVLWGFFAYLVYGWVVERPIAELKKEELRRALGEIPLPPGEAVLSCDASWAAWKAYFGCVYSTECKAEAVLRHYDQAFWRRGWTDCTDRRFRETGGRLYCRGDLAAELSPLRGGRDYSIELTWGLH
jgi:hypothetical protein